MSETVPEGWSVKSLGDFLQPLPKTTLPSSISDELGYYDFYVCSEKVLKSFHKENSSPAVLFSTGGEASIHLATGHYAYSTDVWATEFTGEVCNEYVFRVLEKNLEHINYAGFQGSGIKHLDKGFIQKFLFSFPTLSEQKKIASILTSVDKVIETTQKQIDKLQDLKKATMNELLTRGIGHTEFKDSELGRIPKSWKVRRLDEVSVISRGKFSHRPRNDPDFYDGDHPYLQTGDIPTEVTDITSFTQTLNDKGLGVSRMFPKGTLVLTIAATIGEVGILRFNSCFPDSLVGITCKANKTTPYFLLYSLRSAKQKIISEAPESAQKNLNLDILNPFLIAVPTLNEQKKIETALLSIDHNLKEKTVKLSQTQSLKKSLMQDLLTGKVRVQVN